MRNLVQTFVAIALFTATAAAQPRFTYDDIASGRFGQRGTNSMESMADGEHYTTVSEGKIVCRAYADPEMQQTLFDTKMLGESHLSGYSFSSDEQKILLRIDSRPLYRRSHFSRYAVYSIADKSLTELSTRNDLRYAEFSPDGQKVVYVVDNDIYIETLADGSVTRVTSDGEWGKIINGLPDWVYEEEWAIDRALCWSPDSRKIAFLRSDETLVREFKFMKYLTGTPYPEVFSYKYPKAGEINSSVELYVYSITDGRTTRIDTSDDPDKYVPYFKWTPDGRLYYYLINRLQNHLTVNLVVGNGLQQTIYEEQSPTYIDGISADMVSFLSDSKRYLVLSEREGYNHLYLYKLGKGRIAKLTDGPWNVTEVVAVSDKRIWYLSTETSPLERTFYSIGINSKDKKLLSAERGTSRITPSAGCRYYIENFSNTATPATLTLHRGDGRLLRTLEDNAALKAYIDSIEMPRKEFFTFTKADGTTLNAYIIKPNDFDPSKRYPLLLTQYSGPGSQDVRNRWSVDWEDALVQQGYIVVDCDPRGTGFRSADFKKQTYGIMGRMETEDQTEFAAHMASQPYVDSSRVGIYGWSYGGFMALNCILKGADTFKMAIAVAPVTSWRYYDSVYTERVNGLPQDNPEGYDQPSPIDYAANLKGRLLVIHGTADDNVHIQNTHAMVDRFTRAGKEIDMMLYTDDNHSMMPGGRRSVRQKMVDYCLENL